MGGYVKIQKYMYSLPEAGLLVQELLEKQLAQMDTHKANLPPSCGQTT